MESMLYMHNMIRELRIHIGFFSQARADLDRIYVASQVSFMSRGYYDSGLIEDAV